MGADSAVASYSQAVERCQTHSSVVGFSAALWGFVFAYIRVKQRYPNLLNRNKTVTPVLLGISTIVGYSLQKYSDSSCLERYAAKFPEEAAEWNRRMKEEEKRKHFEGQ
ncbi:UNVERIFIED_CONTAM: hypothetical protein HDU68_007994 [Siphonaria sp. JEL0065]|nr:hypothetical protein HDU68_007994 [Siphonaria sp. JEL0065]